MQSQHQQSVPKISSQSLILLDEAELEIDLQEKSDLYLRLVKQPSFVKKDSLKYQYFSKSPNKALPNEDLSQFPQDNNGNEIGQVKQNQIIPKDVNIIRCKCTKTKCQKNYCECFKAGKICGDQCICIGCHNNEVFVLTFKKSSSGPTCKCQKSNCLKKYCQCHSLGKKCSVLCKCLECYNRQDSQSQKIDIQQLSKPIKKVKKQQINQIKEQVKKVLKNRNEKSAFE